MALRGAAFLKTDTSTHLFLEQWGRWAHTGRGLALNFPSIQPFTRLLGSSIPEPTISDDEALALDRLVCELLEDYPAEGEVVALFYLRCFSSYRSLAKHLEVTDKRVAYLMRSGLMWIDGRLT